MAVSSATGLVETLLAAAEGHPHLNKIMLEVVEGNDRAQRFYERHGFAVFGIETHAARYGDDYLSELMMVRYLDRVQSKP